MTDPLMQIPGLTIVSELGRGAHSVVYRAEHEGQPVALKVMHASALDDAALRAEESLRFRREAAVLARLKNTAVAAVLDSGQTEGRPYLVLEFVDGRTLTEELRQGRFTEARVVEVGQALAGALEALHKLGHVHRDLKPDNVLVPTNGAVKLIDFGLVAAATPKNAGEAAGTFLYAAPEQTGTLSAPLDGRADLYGLGALLFECATGSVPYRARQLTELLQQHATAPVPDARAINQALSPALAGVLTKLLAKHPDQRYQTASGLLADLAQLDRLNSAAGAGHALELDHGTPPSGFHTTLVGRDAELAQLDDAWKSVPGAKGAVALLEGEPGSGKSRLLQEFLARIRQDAWFLSAKCSKGDPLPFAPIREALEGHLARVKRWPVAARAAEEARIIAAAGEAASMLGRLSPQLAALLPRQASQTTTESQDQFYDFVASFLAALVSSNTQKAAVFLLDDLQWMDDASRQVLSRLANGLQSLPLLIAGTSRNDPESTHGLERFATDVAAARLVRLKIGPLDDSAVAQLVSAHLGGGQVRSELIKQISSRSSGNPFAVGEYVRALLDAGLLRFSWGTWNLEAAGLEAVELPADVLSLVTRRIGLLGVEPRRVLSVAALLGSRFSAEVLPGMCQLTTLQVSNALREGAQANLLERTAEGDYAFVHDRVREALTALIPEHELRHTHQAIAQALDQHDHGDPARLYALARHYLMGTREDPSRVYGANLLAGQTALASFAPEEARGFFRHARDLATEFRLPPLAELERDLGQAAWQTRRLDEALEHYTIALPLTKSPVERASLRERRAFVYHARLDTLNARHEIEEGLRDIEASYPRPMGLRVFTSLFYWVAALLLWRTGWRYGQASPERRARLTLEARLYFLGSYVAYFEMDDLQMLQLAFRALYASHFLGDGYERAAASMMYAVLMSVLQRKGAADTFAKVAVGIGERTGDRTIIARLKRPGGMLKNFYGDWRGAASELVQLLKTGERWLDPTEFSLACAELVFNFSVRGYGRECVAWADRLSGKRTDDAATRAQSHTFLAFSAGAYAMLGRSDEGAEVLNLAQRAHQEAPQNKYRNSYLQTGRLLFHLEQGELGEPVEQAIAAHRALQLNPARMPLQARFFFIAQAQVRCAQAERSTPSTLGQQLVALREAIRDLKKAVMVPIFRGHASLAEAVALRLEGRPRGALRLLEEAERIAEENDAPWLVFEVLRNRALLLSAAGNSAAAHRSARMALQLCTEHGWPRRERALCSEFHLESATAGSTTTLASAPLQSAGESSKLKRHLGALLEVSLAAARVFDPAEQARVALSEAIRIFGAERAFLFLVDATGGALVLSEGRDAQGVTLTEARGYSRTVLERVRQDQRPLVVSGTEEGELIGAHSAVVHGLRSIMAAPLKFHDQLLGVIYLDNRVVRGLFTAEDTEVLSAIANHIGIAIESARAAQSELRRKELEKDLSVTATVQALFLPKVSEFESPQVSLAGSYRPANESGGDWWWYDRQPDGKVLLALGDVTGHGVGSAMVTGLITGCFQSLNRGDLTGSLTQLNDTMRRLCSHVYGMTLCFLEVDPGARRLKGWFAGAPAVMIRSQNNALARFHAMGDMLGADTFKVGVTERAYQPGDRLMLMTDGVTELCLPDGKQLGFKPLPKLLAQVAALPAPRARDELDRQLTALRGPTPLNDDVTFILVDCH